MGMRLEPFSKDELERIDDATVRVFERTGVRVFDDEAVSLFEGAGAKPDKKSGFVRIPERVLRECLRSAPRMFKLHARNPKHTISFGEGNVYLSTVGTSVKAEGLDGVVRPSTAKDSENFYRLADALPYIDHTGWACWPRDVPESIAYLQDIFLGFKYSTKTLDGWNLGTRDSERSLDLAAIAAGGREELERKPLLLGFSNPVSPLTLSKESTQGLITYARAGQPCLYPPECMAGGTSPASIAGLLVQQNAEILASVALAQLAKRGAPSIYSTVSSVMDMRTGAIALGAPEAGLISAGSAQLARFYGLPSRGTGGNTEAMVADYQAGAEAASTLMMAALSGFDIIYDPAGSLESSLTASYTKMVLDNDVCGLVKRTLSGIDVDEDSLAVSVIESGAANGKFLSNPHTMRHFRKEHYVPSMMWRGSRSAWDAQKVKDLREKAKLRCQQILKEHVTDPPLDPDVEKKMVQFIKEVAKNP